MSTDEYVPSDEEMLSAYVTGRMMRDDLMRTEAEQEYRRWLAAHDARVRRDAAREALDGLAKAELGRVANLGKHSYPAQIAQGIAQAAWNHKWKHYGGAHPEETR